MNITRHDAKGSPALVKATHKRRIAQSGSRSRNREPFVEVTRPEQLVKILKRLIRARADRRIESILARLHPADIARILTFLPVEDSRSVIKILFKLRKGGATVSELPGSYIAELLSDMDPELTAELLRRIAPDDAVDILQELDEDRRRAVMDILHIDEVAELEHLMAYGDEEAGAIMNSDFFALPVHLTVGEAIRAVRDAGDQLETVFYVYVTDDEGRLIGTVSMRDLLLTEEDAPLERVVNRNVVSVETTMDQSHVAEIIAKYDLLAVPVVDADGVLVGVITVDDVIDVIQEAATEELYRMAGLDEDDRVFSPALRSVRLRLPWLSLNFLTALLAAFVVGLFEDIISKAVLLASFMPVVAGMGGNAGTQTLTVVIRAIALGELRGLNARQAVIKELTVGAINGLAMGLVGGTIAWLWRDTWWLGLLIGVAMVVNLCVAALGGALVPLILKRFRLDPAIGSSIFLTTMTDVAGFLVFLGLATWLLPLLGIV